MNRTDVLVAGGGVAGIAAALASARAGAKTTLVEREYMLGGLATAGLITIYLPLCDGFGKQVSFGIAEELLKLSISHGAEADYPDAWLDHPDNERRASQRYLVRYNAQMFALLAEKALLEAGVEILYGMQVQSLQMENGAIRSATLLGRFGPETLECVACVDATGDAILAQLAGAPTRAFWKGNILAAWYYSVNDEKGLRLHTLGAADRPETSKDAPAVKLLTNRRFSGLDSRELSEMVVASHGCILNDVLKAKETASETVPVTIPTVPQVRMTQCLVGAQTLGDENPHRYEPRSIGMVSDWRARGPVYELPFEVLYGNEVANLYAAGRCISVTDNMWDITRVIPDCAVTGQAAGQAAAMQAKQGARPDIADLQRALENAGVKLHE